MAVRRTIGRVSVVTPPSVDVLPLSTIKAHLRVDGDHDDHVIVQELRAAIGELDAPHGWLGRSLMSRTLRLTFDEIPGDVIELPGPPTTAVSAITYRDLDDVWHTLSPSAYEVDLTAEPAIICLEEQGWPVEMDGGLDGVRVEYVTGYLAQSAVPAPIRQWLLMRVGEMYRDRELSLLGVTSTRLSHADRMLDAWRIYR